MKEKLAQYYHELQVALLEIAPLSPEGFEFLKSKLKVITCRQDQTLHLSSSDILYVADGLLKEEEDHKELGTQIHRFLQKGDVLFPARKTGNSQFIAIQDTILFRVKRKATLEIIKQHLELITHFEHLLNSWYLMAFRRLKLLIIVKRKRYGKFIATFPGLASLLLDKDIIAYLDISRSYFIKHK